VDFEKRRHYEYPKQTLISEGGVFSLALRVSASAVQLRTLLSETNHVRPGADDLHRYEILRFDGLAIGKGLAQNVLLGAGL
jgi:hypothetical protein